MLPRYVKLSVIVTGCVPISVNGGVARGYSWAEGLKRSLGPVDM